MLANALANSGSTEFRSDDKEQYIRIVRDLSPSDLSMLHDLAPRYERASAEGYSNLGFTMVDGKSLPSLARLTALGLVDESFKTPGNAPYVPYGDTTTKPVARDYQISPGGRRFIRFLSRQHGKCPQGCRTREKLFTTAK